MPNQLANPLQNLIARAAGLPARTGIVDQFRARHERTHGDKVILADVSGSMREPVWGAKRKIDLLREAVADVIAENRCRLVTFGNSAAECDPAAISEPEGGTRLDLGLGAVARLQPRATLVISDGRPDKADLALAAADTVTGVMHVLYVGPDSDANVIAFMDLLARRGAGRYRHADIRDRDAVLKKEIRLMLGWQP